MHNITKTNRNAHQPPVNIDREVYDVQTRLLDLVDSYLEGTSPVTAINELLEKWLTTPPADLSDPLSRQQLAIVLRLVDFLTELRESHMALTAVLDLNASRKEVDRG